MLSRVRKRGAGIGVLAAVVTVSASASAAPQRDALVRPGVAVGKVRVGMPFQQVRGVLGRPQVVLRQRRYGFDSLYTEYAWGGTNWTVAVVGRGNAARVVSVSTGLRRERTRAGIGVGSTERSVRRTLGARCFDKEAQFDPITGERVYIPVTRKDTMYCFLGRDRDAAHTAFSLGETCLIPTPHPMICPKEKRLYRVFEVTVGQPRFTWGYWGD
jgi:hypothetical protein